MRNRLPPLGALLAFEAAAKSGSFATAAQQLFVTPAAISQQIRTLESHLQIVLFERSKSGVKLTRAAQSYLIFVEQGLAQLRLGQQQLQQFDNLDVLTISALPSVAQKWLMPLVMEWMSLHPAFEVRVEASHTRVNFNNSASDMCISFGIEGYKDFHREKLLRDQVSLVLSPQLAETLEVVSVENVCQLPMIHVDWGNDNRNLPQWSDWLALNEQRLSYIQPGPRFNLSSMAIEAAVQSKGVLLGQHLLIQKELASSQLISPFKQSLTLGEDYYLVYPQRTLDNPKAAAFIEWLKQRLC